MLLSTGVLMIKTILFEFSESSLRPLSMDTEHHGIMLNVVNAVAVNNNEAARQV